MPTTAQLSGVANEDLFASGKLGMDVIGIWQFAAFKDLPFKWDIQIEPMINQHAAHFFANGIAVSASSAECRCGREVGAVPDVERDGGECAREHGLGTACAEPAELLHGLPEADAARQPSSGVRFAGKRSRAAGDRAAERNAGRDWHLVGQVADGTLSSQDALDQAKAQLDELLKSA